ncbi:hypothetical protein [Aureimonas leprariae]|uniref:Glycosyltransferase RgtA/B/C/D-like domain-containing protein n=1 Tax=Plantimonas leprariae TaxID=2615207 RepID=A0A7V7PNN4_9HYPH|nr:hypothetical protein [Aureimonas leprariae]KAB0679387.1 hypothetical protein F6X38_13725 [Aureimonas leprariae]
MRPVAVPKSGETERRWLALALGFGLLAAATFVGSALTGPGGIQDDARQFLSWMGRWSDPAPLRGDLVGDYWQSVTPWFYTALFRAASAVGIGPVLFAKLLSALLLPLAALFAYRFGRAMDARPPVAALAAGGFLLCLQIDGPINGGVPRSLWPVLLAALLDGLARRRTLQVALAQLCLAGSYPQLALVTATVIGLTFLDPARPGFLDLSRARLVLVASAAAATVAGILPFLLGSGAFDPVATLAEARALPSFGFAGRNRIVDADGSLNFLCGQRLGFLGNKCRGSLGIGSLLVLAAMAAGPVALFWRAARPGRTPAPLMRSTLPLFLFLASAGWFAVASFALFRLHLPSRYTTALFPFTFLTTLPILIEWGLGSGREPLRPPRRLAVATLGAALAVGIAAFGTVKGHRLFRQPAEPALVAYLRDLPREAVIAGFVSDLDFSPVLTNRSTLFSRELAIGYQLGYLRPVMARMADMRDAVLTADPAVLADRLRRNGVTVFLAEAETLGPPRVPAAFRGFFPAAELAAAETQAAGRPSALARRAPACTLRRFGTVLALDARCLAAETKTPAGQAGASGS